MKTITKMKYFLVVSLLSVSIADAVQSVLLLEVNASTKEAVDEVRRFIGTVNPQEKKKLFEQKLNFNWGEYQRNLRGKITNVLTNRQFPDFREDSIMESSGANIFMQIKLF